MVAGLMHYLTFIVNVFTLPLSSNSEGGNHRPVSAAVLFIDCPGVIPSQDGVEVSLGASGRAGAFCFLSNNFQGGFMPKQPSVRAKIARSKAHLHFLRSTLRDLSLSISIDYRPDYLCSDPELCRNALVWLDRAEHELFEIETRLRRKRGAR